MRLFEKLFAFLAFQYDISPPISNTQTPKYQTHRFIVDRAGPERTEAGESAPSRHEDSPRPGRTKCELCETLQDLIMGVREEASINLPCLLILASSWTARPSRPYSSELQATRGTLCC